ncbi:hypothetical protein BH11PLA1_BH11PLA1_20900 [soil metagenome]
MASDTFKPGDTIKCTITATPKSWGNKTTVQRLMRLDPDAIKSLRRAYRLRKARMVVYNRGNRDWTKREICAKIVTPVKGGSWTMPFNANLIPDLASVANCIKVERA